MFKGILPAKRMVSSDFTMITPLDTTPGATKASSKSSRPSATTTKTFIQAYEKKKRSDPKAAEQSAALAGPATNQAFDKLLDDLQIPSTLRPKLAGMDSTVKAAMLKSSHVRTRSTESLSSPRPGHSILEELRPPVRPFAPPPQLSSHHSSSSSSHTRGISFDAMASRSNLHLPMSASVTDLNDFFSGSGRPTKDKYGAIGKQISAAQIISTLSSTSTTALEVETVKKLRLLLRNESATWSQEFLKLGGYAALLTRLNEILEVEWREEQHDDQVLHELLRCFKALSTSSIGCFALRSSCPTPFVQLVALLYSDKKPGDVATRQLIVDLLLILFELYPSSALPSQNSPRGRREAWESTTDLQPSNLIILPSPHKTFFSLIRALLLTPAPPPAESPAAPVSPHAFIESLHKPRIYKTYLQELSDVCRDYFWVFCHPSNTIWALSQTDEGRVEKPRAPGGMTGGVEFEAVGYFTTHLRLINAIAKVAEDLNLPKDHDLSAFRLHSDLFLSGFERIILVSRKASTTYYPTLHLELARYIAYVGRAGYELPWAISRVLGAPPPALAKNPPPPTAPKTPTQGSPSKRRSSKAPPPGFMLAQKLDFK
ncbi:hypothetical protein BDZ89DRAFT_1060369 [Hymenopellis radicata]|nr:hypothetical protein BDZ89DRAFT_1060369 [Hymenopellis radicata]